MAGAIRIETVSLDSFTMKYFKFGSGSRTMVILPGLAVQSVMAYASSVAESYRIFADEYTVYLFDRRDSLPEIYGIRQMAEDTAKAMKSLGLSGVYLFGASQGGMMAALMAADHPELVKCLVLGSTAGKGESDAIAVIDRWIHLAAQKDGRGLYLNFGEKVYPPEAFETFKDALIAAGETVTGEECGRFITLAKGLKDFDASVELAKISCPVLVLGSTDDQVLGGAASENLAAALTGSSDVRVHMYTGYGHAAYDMAPDYKERIYGFFSEIS